MKAIIAATLILFAGPAFAADACTAQIPSSLKVALAKAFPNFRPPLATDKFGRGH